MDNEVVTNDFQTDIQPTDAKTPTEKDDGIEVVTLSEDKEGFKTKKCL